MSEILAFLALFGCYPTDEIEIDIHLRKPAVFLDGKVYLREQGTPANVLVHELYHSCQTSGTYFEREADARRVELIWLNR